MTSALPELLDSAAARAVLELARRTEAEPVFHHSVRAYLFAELLARHEGLRAGEDYDREAVFFGCVLHDLGTGSAAPGKVRFEVEGADIAATLLSEHGYPKDLVDSVWESIALHTSPGIAERRGAVCSLVRHGVVMDFGRNIDFIDDATAKAIHERHPRLAMERALAEAVVAHAAKSPEAAPRYSFPGEVLRERQQDGVTTMERAATESRWAR